MEMFMTGADPDEVWPLVRDFHYSRRMPANIQHAYAVRGSGGLFGDKGDVLAAVLFSIPPTRWSEDVIELSRLVRCPTFDQPLSQLIGFACGWLRKQGWALAVSFADRTQNHHGGIYQAAGWNYDGCRDRRMDGLVVDGQWYPGRTCNHVFGTQSPTKLAERFPGRSIVPHFDEGKHLYWKPLRVAGKAKGKRLGLQATSYPKPNAARPADAPIPIGASKVQPLGAAPDLVEC